MPIPALIPAAGALLGKLGLGTKLASALTAEMPEHGSRLVFVRKKCTLF